MPGPLRATRRRHLGFTLIELLVVLTIAAVLLGIGVPSLQSFVVGTRLDTHASEFNTSLQYARSEALRRNAAVSVSPVVAADTADWSDGWRVFVDTNANGSFDAGDELLRAGSALPAPFTLFASTTLGERIEFDGRGRVSRGTGALVLCHDGELQATGQSRSRAILINAAGRVRMGSDSDQDGRIETDTGVVASCTQP